MWRQSQLKQRTLVPSSQDKKQLKKVLISDGNKTNHSRYLLLFVPKFSTQVQTLHQ